VGRALIFVENLWQQVDLRLRRGVPQAEGFLPALRHHHAEHEVEHEMDPDGFLEYVHQIDHSPIEPHPGLPTRSDEDVSPVEPIDVTNFYGRHDGPGNLVLPAAHEPSSIISSI
jgi:hypothetical protein